MDSSLSLISSMQRNLQSHINFTQICHVETTGKSIDYRQHTMIYSLSERMQFRQSMFSWLQRETQMGPQCCHHLLPSSFIVWDSSSSLHVSPSQDVQLGCSLAKENKVMVSSKSGGGHLLGCPAGLFPGASELWLQVSEAASAVLCLS